MCEIKYEYLRPRKAEQLKRMHDTLYTKRDDLRIWQGEKATILPVRKDWNDKWAGSGGVVDADGICVPGSGASTIPRLGYEFGTAEYCDAKVVYCGYLIHHWGHFLLEATSRLWYFLQNDLSIDKYVFVLDENEEREIKGNYKEFLVLLGIWDRLEIINRPMCYRQVIVPEPAFHCGKHYSSKFWTIFDTVARNISINSEWKSYQKIFMSRSRLGKSGNVEFGGEALDDFYSRNGYKVLFPETLSLSQMVYYIRNAESVASVSGSLPHNMLFGRKGQRIDILERCVENNDWQVGINHLMELRVTYVDSNIPLYSVSMNGPLVLAFDHHMEKYARDNGMIPPDSRYTSHHYLKKLLVKYMKSYRRQYQYLWFMPDYLVPSIHCICEAYQDGLRYYGDYLHGAKPFMWKHYFQTHYWKVFAIRLLRNK